MNPNVDRRWQRARRYLQEQQFSAARVQWDAMRQADPGDMYTRLLGARIAWNEGHLQSAAAQALDAAQATIDGPAAAAELIETLLVVGETALANRLLEETDWSGIASPELLFKQADLSQRLRHHAQALAGIDALIAQQPDNGRWHFERGHQLEFLGRLPEAEEAYATCLALMPTYGNAAYNLVRLRRQTPADHRLDAILDGLRRVPPGSVAQADFEFARYHVLDNLGDTDAAWQALATANQVMQALTATMAQQQREGLERFCRHVAGMEFRRAGTKADGARPIFIIGMHRSGTTVLERMLTNHSQVGGAGELSDFFRQILREADAVDPFSSEFLDRLPSLDLAAAGTRYLAQTQWRADGKPCYTDKQPANWEMAGMIHAALPRSRILHLVRDPMDTCFSLWRARLAPAQAWSFDFGTLAARYIQYRQWMRHWHEVIPGAILDVDYARLVTDPVPVLQEVMAFCGLEWEAGCEDPARNANPVSTLSSAQVRRPLDRRGVGHWKRYAAQLEPLRQRLSVHAAMLS